jgi:hypothetical protein
LTFDALTGKPLVLGFSTYGQVVGSLGAPAAMFSKFMDRPGEQFSL